MTKEKTKWEICFKEVEENINKVLPPEIREEIKKINKKTRREIMNRTTYLVINLFGKKEDSDEYKKGIKQRVEEITETIRDLIKNAELGEVDKQMPLKVLKSPL